MVHISHLQESYLWKYLCQQHNAYIVIFNIIISISMPKDIYVSQFGSIRGIDGKQIFDGRFLENVFSAFGKRISLSNYATQIRF